MSTVVVDVATREGPGRLLVDRAAQARSVIVLGHGAGGGVTAADLVLLAHRLPAAGITVARFEQPWRMAGRKVAVSPPRLDVGWCAAVGWLRGDPGSAGTAGTPLVVGGRSAGARVACRTATELGAAGVLCLSFPLHPPGRPESTRVDELTGVRVPTLVVQGERDPFGTPAEFPDGQQLVVVPSADHSLRTPKRSGVTAEDVAGMVVEAALELIDTRMP